MVTRIDRLASNIASPAGRGEWLALWSGYALSLTSCTQSGPVGGLRAREGMQGSTNPSVRTRHASIRLR
jgi:hypothetical protein